MAITRIREFISFGESLPEGVDIQDTSIVSNATIVTVCLLLNTFEKRIGDLEQALKEIYESNPGTYEYDNAELASARWEVAAKALGKI